MLCGFDFRVRKGPRYELTFKSSANVCALGGIRQIDSLFNVNVLLGGHNKLPKSINT